MDNHRREETRAGRYSVWKKEKDLVTKLTSNEGKSAQTSESTSVYVENVKSFAEFENTVEPIAEATLTLFQCQDHAVAKCQLGVLRFRAVRQSKNE